MSNNRMLALVAILAGGLMVGACGESITGPGDLAGPGPDPVEEVINDNDGVTPMPEKALVNDPKGNDHADPYVDEL